MSRWLRGSDAWIFGGLLVVALVAKAPALAETLKAQFVSAAPAANSTVESAALIEASAPPATPSAAGAVVESTLNTQPVTRSPFRGSSCQSSCSHLSY